MNELLMPAGSIEKMKYAFAYGADAVYLGLVDFSLRALRKGELIDETNLKTAVDIANVLNKKAACILSVTDSLVKPEELTPAERQTALTNMITLGLETAIKL